MVMRVGGPQAPSPPSPGRLSCTRTLYPVFGLRFIMVTFSLGSTEDGMQKHTSFGRSRSHYSPSALSSPYAILSPLILPSFLPNTAVPPQLSPHSPTMEDQALVLSWGR